MLKSTLVSRLFMGWVLATAGVASAQASQPHTPLASDSLPQEWQYESEFAGQLPDADSQMWWRRFGDPTLDSLMAIGLANNYNVLMAARRMEIARQTLNEVRSQYFPTLTLSGGWNKNRTSGAMVSSATRASASSYFSLGADMSWQIDLFGKITAQARENRAEWQATRAEYAGAMLTLCGDIASSYVQLRVLQAQKRVAEYHLKSQQAVLKIAEARHEAGLASELDVLQASTVYLSTEASLPSLDTSLAKTQNAMAVLLGEAPSDRQPVTDGPLPDFRVLFGTGVPMDLLRRRPDIAEAEATLAAYAAAVGIAKKDFLPTLTLNGSISTASHRLGDLFHNNALEYSVAPTLSWTLFEGMRRKYALASAREQMLAGIDSYNLTVIQAVAEVDNAMAAYNNACREVELTQKVADESRKSVELAVDLYRSGLSGFTNVADAQIDYLTYSNSLIVARGKALAALISLCEALGGGWDDTLPLE